jgi:hypothetical protein
VPKEPVMQIGAPEAARAAADIARQAAAASQRGPRPLPS